MGVHRRLAAALLVAITVLLVVGGSAVAQEQERRPILWVVDTEPKIYLFGTMHVGDPRVLAHPAVLEHALKESDAVYTEVLLDAAPPAAMVQRMRLPAGQTLDKILPKELYERTAKLLEGKGPPLQMFNGMKPWVILLRLQLLDADPATQKGVALDAELAKSAKTDGKVVDALETVDEQLDIFDGLTNDEQVKLLEQTVTQIEKARADDATPLEKLTKVYLEGDEEKLLQLMYSELDPDDELSNRLMKKVLDDRNVRMVKRMLEKAFAAPDKTHFVAVGAGHYPGEKGIVALLRKTGFKVRRLNAMADLVPETKLRRGRSGSRPARAPATTRPAVARSSRPRYRIRRFGPFCWRECCPCPCP